jgi:hypothetical protein
VSAVLTIVLLGATTWLGVLIVAFTTAVIVIKHR